MSTPLTREQLVERYTECANALAEWINNAPKDLDVAAVYDAHAILCHLILEFAKAAENER